MRNYRSMFLAIGLMIGHAAVAAIGSVVDFTIHMFKCVLDCASPYVWRAIERVKLAAVRVIEKLKPVYRESYLTAGQSLDHRWRSC
ncbi:hypothetical protein [Hoeflea sp.]|uniref:hypothetical protein n=1 Tax=Hoeflea sp. TaxID=1940281 RepID=UPI003A8CD779